MTSYARDPWMQMFAVMAATSGLLSALHLATRLPELPTRQQAPYLPPNAAQAPAAETPKVQAAPSAPAAPSAAVSPPQAPGPAYRSLTARTPGRWLVDPAGGADADTTLIAEALFNARDGDEIDLRPGRYRESLSVAKSVRIAGQGRPGDVILQAAAGEALSASGARLALSGLTVIGGPSGAAVSAAGGALELTDVALSGIGVGVSASAGAVVSLERVSISGLKWGLLLEGGKASVDQTTIDQGEVGVTLARGETLRITHSTLSRLDQAVRAIGAGVDAEVSSTKIAGGKDGLVADGEAALRIQSSQLSDNSGCAVKAADAGTKVQVLQSDLSGNGQGACLTRSAQGVFSEVNVMNSAEHAFSIDGAAATISRSTLLRDGPAAVAVSDGGEADLSSVHVSNAEVALSLDGESKADLNDVTLSDNQGEGVLMMGNSSLRGRKLAIRDNRSCGVIIQDDGTVSLSGSQLTGNLCGVALYRIGAATIDGCDLTGNQRGPLLYKSELRDRIKLVYKRSKPLL